MTFEPSDAEILELIKRKSTISKFNSENWIIQTCNLQITEMETTIVKLKKLINLCKDPNVVAGIELFVGRK